MSFLVKKHRRMDAAVCLPKESMSGMVRCKKRSFMEAVSDDLLEEILVRLPDGQSLVRSTAVCKRWHSLVHKTPSFDDFVARFIRHHAAENRPYPDSTLALFNCSPKTKLPVTFHELMSGRPYDLSFMPPNVVIRACCGDLLLLSRGYWQYYICNSVTRRWFALPQLQRYRDFAEPAHRLSWGYALVVDSPSPVGFRFRVVVVSDSRFSPPDEYVYYVAVFDSGTGAWTEKPIIIEYQAPSRVPRSTSYIVPLDAVHTSRGVVHWLDGNKDMYAVAAFDPISSESHLIPLPCRFRGVRNYGSKDRVRIGVVRGRLRLLKMDGVNKFRFRLRIWELLDTEDDTIDCSDDTRWRLVHHLLVNKDSELCFVLYMDPNDGNVIFLVRGNRITRYRIDQAKDVPICELPCHGAESLDEMKQSIAIHLQVLTLVLPPWPTPISGLASHQP